jgi:hypothetical protein
VHCAVETPGYLLVLCVTAANQQECAQVKELAAQVQELTGEDIEAACVDQPYTGEAAIEEAQTCGINSKSSGARGQSTGLCCCQGAGWWRGVLPGARFRRLARDYERLCTTVAALHFIACACLMPARLFTATNT